MPKNIWIGQVAGNVGGSTAWTVGPRQGGQNWNTPESARQITTELAGTFSSLTCNVIFNAATANSTFSFRKNTAAGNETLTVPTGATGNFEDVVNTDTVAATNVLAYQFVQGSAGTVTVRVRSSHFTSTSIANGTALILGSGFNNTFTAVSETDFMAFPSGGANTTEANEQIKALTDGTLRNLYSQVTVNTRSSTSVYHSRINSADKNLTISWAGGVTGIAEDTANTDAVNSSDLINLSIVLGTGGGLTLNERALSASLTTTNNNFVLAGNAGAGLAVSAQTLYTNFGFSGNSVAESDFRQRVGMSLRASQLWLFISVSTTTAASTIQFRVDSGNGNQLVSPGAAATGAFQDTANSDKLRAQSLIAFRNDVGAGSLTIRGESMLFSNPFYARSQFFQFFPNN